MKRLEGKIAIVTGAGRGIGRGIAIAYSREGANVVVASRTKSTVDSTVSEIQAEGGTALGIACDGRDAWIPRRASRATTPTFQRWPIAYIQRR